MASVSPKALAITRAILIASIIAIVGTVQHQSQLESTVPVGLFFSLAIVFFGAAHIRDQSSTKGPGLTYAVVIALMVFLIGRNLTNDILIPGNDLGIYWSYGSIGIAMIVALWPKLRTKP